VTAADRRALLTPAFREAATGSGTVRRATFAWRGPDGRRRTYADRVRGYGLLLAASAQAKGWETTVTWTRPRARDTRTAPPFRSPADALAYLDSMAAEPAGGQYRRAAAAVRRYTGATS
jgi:hypothetical protein